MLVFNIIQHLKAIVSLLTGCISSIPEVSKWSFDISRVTDSRKFNLSNCKKELEVLVIKQYKNKVKIFTYVVCANAFIQLSKIPLIPNDLINMLYFSNSHHEAFNIALI